MQAEIVIVSGLPRSGTSLMMQMLDKGGIEVVTDSIRTADTDNPKGYYEFEHVKKIKEDTSWLPPTRGKVFKMVSQLLYHLPPTETYRIIFMDRDLEEMLASQEKMLERLGRPVGPRESMTRAFAVHLQRLFEWLPRQRHLAVLRVSYNNLLESPREQAQCVSDFLDGRPSVERMTQAVDPSLYRNRKTAGERPGLAAATKTN
jgi:hypothetical protein